MYIGVCVFVCDAVVEENSVILFTRRTRSQQGRDVKEGLSYVGIESGGSVQKQQLLWEVENLSLWLEYNITTGECQRKTRDEW